MSENTFAFHPADPDRAVDGSSVDRWLLELGLASPAGLGSEFSAWLRCGHLTPEEIQTAIERPDGSPLGNTFRTRWAATSTHAETTVLVGCETSTPRCPCGVLTTEEWPDLVDRWWHDRSHRWLCQCGRATAVPALDFEHTVGFARTFVELPHGLAPELRPTPRLLDELARRSGVRWSWTWVRR